MSLYAELRQCFKYRKTELPKSFSDELKKLNTAQLERGWMSAVSSLSNAPKFETAYERLINAISEKL